MQKRGKGALGFTCSCWCLCFWAVQISIWPVFSLLLLVSFWFCTGSVLCQTEVSWAGHGEGTEGKDGAMCEAEQFYTPDMLFEQSTASQAKLPGLWRAEKEAKKSHQFYSCCCSLKVSSWEHVGSQSALLTLNLCMANGDTQQPPPTLG